MSRKHISITDKQVLSELRLRRLRLKVELERVDLAIKAFENIKEIDPLDAVIYEVEEMETSEEIAVSILMYNPRMSTEKKILYVLERLGRPANVQDITEYLVRVDGHIKNVAALFNNVTYVASRMYKSGKIDADKEGRKNLYYLR